MALIGKYALEPVTPITLFSLTKQSLNSAGYVHRELPVRLARRVAAVHALPYIVVSSC